MHNVIASTTLVGLPNMKVLKKKDFLIFFKI